MDIEEIKCPICTQVYNDQSRAPILLPDCGHSYCQECIYECFDMLSPDKHLQKLDDKTEQQANVNCQVFRCPDDNIECSIQNPQQLPKNYALLKILQKAKESEEERNKNVVLIKYQEKEQNFIACKKEDKSLAKFLSYDKDTLVKSQAFPGKQANLVENQKLQICKIHNRQLDLICADHKERICDQCALFGSHRGHDIRQEDEAIKEVSLKVEVLMEMYQAMEQSCDDLNVKTNFEKSYNLFKQQQISMKEKVQNQFKEWRQALRAIEMEVINNMYIKYQPAEEKFQQAFNHNNKMISEAQCWMEKTKAMIDDYTKKVKSDHRYVALDLIDNSSKGLADESLNQGEFLLNRAEQQRDFPTLKGIESKYSQVHINFEPNFMKRLENIAKVVNMTRHESSSDQTTATQSFFNPVNNSEDIESTNNAQTDICDATEDALNLSAISFDEIPSPLNRTNRLQKELRDCHEDEKQETQQVNSTNSNNKQVMESRLKRMSSCMEQKPKGKSGDLMTIFKTQAVNGYLDLSNKNLTDMHVNDLVKCIKSGSGHIKTLNLAKNKIQDEAMIHIAKALCESSIECVNASSNKLTDKCAEQIAGCLKTNKTLKQLDLQNNGIASRLMKNKLKNGLPQIEVLI